MSSKMSLTHFEQKANRLALAASDMLDVQRYLTAWTELDEAQRGEGTSRYFDCCEGLLVAAIVSYCRSFKASRSRDKAVPQLVADDLGLFQDQPDLAALHTLILERRDKSIAHADWQYHQTELVSVDSSGVLRRSPIPRFVEGVDADVFIELAHTVRQVCISQLLELDRRQWPC
jgi:hypothetical protein